MNEVEQMIEMKNEFAQIERVQENVAYQIEMVQEDDRLSAKQKARKIEHLVQVRENAELFWWLQKTSNRWNDFLRSVFEQWHNQERVLSEKQLDSATRTMRGSQEREAKRIQERAERVATLTALPVFTKEFVIPMGRVIKSDWKKTEAYGWTLSTTVEIMVGEFKGCRIWFRAPKVFRDYKNEADVRVGDVVSLTLGELNRSDKDEFMGFGKRPKNAVFVERAPKPEAE